MSGESLEQRICLSAVRIVAWNTANRPNNPSEDALYRTVFEAIGNENVGSGAIPPSIIALQETDNQQGGGDSIDRIENLLETLYPTISYGYAVTNLDSGDDANGFVYNTGLFDLVETTVVEEVGNMQSFAHNIIRGQFRPENTSGDSDFYLYSTHLKAGSGDNDMARRTAEANAIRVDIDSLGAEQDVIVLGDFNIGGSSEGGYRSFLASGNGQLFDPIDTPGEWKNNSSFIDVHTQNPEINGPGGMDDRFDIQLVSDTVFDDQGLQFIEGSYRAFGNNGTHTFNSDITTGTGASSSVLAALAAASDHLPVIVDYEIAGLTEGLVISQSDGSTDVSESGADDTYTISLETVPTDDVTVTITADAQVRVEGNAQATFRFTPASALQPQTVRVSAVDDAIGEGIHTGVLTHSFASADSIYGTLTPVDLAVGVVDNDLADVVITELMYNPAGAEPDGEWIEIANVGSTAVNLGGWLIDDEDSLNWSEIPASTPALNAGDIAIIHNSQISSSVFRSRWSLPAEVHLIGVTWGSLSNSPSPTNEEIQLLDSAGNLIDQVNYDNDGNLWPTVNNGTSIYVTDPRTDNDDGTNWRRSVVGVDSATNPSGSPFSTSDTGSPGFVPNLKLDPPLITEIRFDQNDPTTTQRSMLRETAIVFDQKVDVASGAFELINLESAGSTSAQVTLSIALTDIGDRTEATLTFAGDWVESASGSLADGNYQLTIFGDQVTDRLTGLALDADGDGNAGGDRVIGQTESDRFFRLFGDTDGDRDVDTSDFVEFGPAYLKASGDVGFNQLFDHDGDGDIDGRDLGQFRRRLGTRLDF